MHALSRLMTRPRIGSRIAATVLTVAGLVPLLARLPKVAVVACFEAGHPLYAWVPEAPFTGSAHCLTAPAPSVGWTLMIAATLVVQVLALPLILGLGAALVRGARNLAHTARGALTLALVGLAELRFPDRRQVAVPVRVPGFSPAWSRANPRRGPPRCL